MFSHPLTPPFFSQIGKMEVEERTLGTLDAALSARFNNGDMEAVEALMSMMKHSNIQNSWARDPRPLTPFSDCSEDESAPTGAVAMQRSPLVRGPLEYLYYSPHDCLNSQIY